jgi:hypothetical protein
MTEVIDTLILKQDTFEIVRDQIALILVTEVANQMALATAAAEDPLDWKLRIFTERSNAWEQFLNLTNATDLSPLVNVWYDNGSFPENKGNTVERQAHEAIYNLDCYGVGVSADVSAGGHTPGDKEAAFEVQRTIRLVRNILMAAINTYLQLRGTVWQRWIQSITVFQPQIDNQAIQHIVGARIALRVLFNEFSPQVDAEILEKVVVDVKRTEDGEIVLQTTYEYPLP